MHKYKLLILSTILMLSACASTTPIAVSTPHWVVPSPDPELQAQYQAAIAEVTAATQNWNKWLYNLPGLPPTPGLF